MKCIVISCQIVGDKEDDVNRYYYLACLYLPFTGDRTWRLKN